MSGATSHLQHKAVSNRELYPGGNGQVGWVIPHHLHNIVKKSPCKMTTIHSTMCCSLRSQRDWVPLIKPWAWFYQYFPFPPSNQSPEVTKVLAVPLCPWGPWWVSPGRLWSVNPGTCTASMYVADYCPWPWPEFSQSVNHRWFHTPAVSATLCSSEDDPR